MTKVERTMMVVGGMATLASIDGLRRCISRSIGSLHNAVGANQQAILEAADVMADHKRKIEELDSKMESKEKELMELRKDMQDLKSCIVALEKEGN